jgi:hypothetical protein
MPSGRLMARFGFGLFVIGRLALLLLGPSALLAAQDSAERPADIAVRRAPAFLSRDEGLSTLGLAAAATCDTREAYDYLVLSGVDFLPAILSSPTDLRARLPLAGDDVFWSDSSETPVSKANFTARTVTPLVARIGALKSYAVSGDTVYWADTRPGAYSPACLLSNLILHSTPLTGGATTVLSQWSVCGAPQTGGVVADADNAYIVSFVAATTPPNQTWTILKVPLGGGSPVAVHSSNEPILNLIDDPANLYWEEPSPSGSVWTAVKSSGVVAELASGLGSLQGGLRVQGSGLILSDTNGQFGGDRVLRVPIAGGSMTVLASGVGTVFQLATDANSVYWVGQGGIWTLPGGASPTLLTSDVSVTSVTSLAVAGQDLVWTEGFTDSGRIRHVPVTGGAVSSLATLLDPPAQIATDALHVYWQEFDKIASLPIGGGQPTTVVSGVSSDLPPIATDGRNVYVADGLRIKRVPVAGGPVETIQRLSSAIDIATDGAFVYWMGSYVVSVNEAPVDGGSGVQLAYDPFSPGRLALDSAFVYWFDGNGAIKRVPKDGGTVETVLQDAQRSYSDLVVDGSRVYFSDQNQREVASVSVNGGSVTPLLIGFPPSWISLALDADTLYWATKGSIGKIRKAGSQPGFVALGLPANSGIPDGIVASDQTLYFTNVYLGLIVRAVPANVFQFTTTEYAVAEPSPLARVSVRRLGNIQGAAAIDYVTWDGTAQAGIDYQSVAATLSFPPGSTVQAFNVPILPDTRVDGSRTVLLELRDPDCSRLGEPSTAVLTIADNDVGGAIQFSPATYSVDARGGAGSVNVTVRRSGGLASGVTVHYATGDGTASQPADYTSTSGDLTFASSGTSATTQTFTVPVAQNTTGAKTFTVTLSGPTGGAVLGTPTVATVAILGAQPTLWFGAPSYTVKTSQPNAVITVKRSAPLAGTVTVDYATADITATSGTDYTGVSGTLTFGPNVSARTFAVPITKDPFTDANEQVGLSLSGQTWTLGPAAIDSTLGSAILTISNANMQPTLQFSVATYTVNEATPKATITVKRTGDLFGTVAVDYATSDGTAAGAAGPAQDYVPAAGTLTFGPNQKVRTFPISIINDTLDEGTETVNLTLSNATWSGTSEAAAVSATLDTAVLNITDNEPTVQFSAPTYSASEASKSLRITVKRTGNPAGVATVDYAVTGDSATDGVDDTLPSPGTMTFMAGQTSRTLTIAIINDMVSEGNETVDLALSNPTGGVRLGTPSTAIVTIRDNDVAGTARFSATDYSVDELAGVATIGVTRTGTSSEATVAYETADGTGVANTDYTAASGTLTFGQNEKSKTFSVPILDDGAANSGITKTVLLTLSGPGNGLALGSPSTATLWIVKE